MNRLARSLKRSSVAWLALLLAGGPIWAQSPGDPFPYSGFSFGSTDRPNPGQAPNNSGGALPPNPESGTFLRPLTSPLSAPQMFAPGSAPEDRNVRMPPPDDSSAPRPDNRARIWLLVPADAEVWFEGAKTKQTGALRHYFSPPLAAGRKFSYQMQARWSKDGRPVEWKQQIDVRAGDALRLDLSMVPAEKNAAVLGTEKFLRPQAGK